MKKIVVYQEDIDLELDTFMVVCDTGIAVTSIILTRKELVTFRNDIDAILAHVGELGE